MLDGCSLFHFAYGFAFCGLPYSIRRIDVPNVFT